MSEILVFGAGGQIGKSLIEYGSSELIGLSRAEVDICERQAVVEAVSRYRPKFLINTAAYTAVDRAESEPEEAFRVNPDGARVLAQVASAAGIPFLHLSTDYVFDGETRAPYTEDNPVRPLSVYGRSKEAGEIAIREVCSKHIILRTSWVYSPYGINFVKTMLRLGSKQAELRIVDDQTGCPTAAADVAKTLLTIAAVIGTKTFNDWGTYHYAGADAVSWYQFAQTIFAEAMPWGGAPKLRPIATTDYPTQALRPAYSVLSSNKLQRTFGVKPRALRESLDDCLARLYALGAMNNFLPSSGRQRYQT